MTKVPKDPKKADLLPVRLVGHYDSSQTFLLDNRVMNGRVGFWVLKPFDDTNLGEYVLVNRGFVPMGRTRHDMPDIPAMAPHSNMAVGHVHVADTDREKKPESDTSSLGSGVTIVEVASPRLISRLMGKPFYPHVVRLARSDPNALPRFWPVTMMMPSRHRGYAAQWFLMAVAVVIAWSAVSFKRERQAEET